MDIDESLVLLGARADDAEHAIRISGSLLVKAGRATTEYVDAMVKAYRELGPYIVLAPQIAMPHARPENGAVKEGIAVVRLAEPMEFGHPDNDPVRVVIPLVGVDADAHITVLRKLSTVLMNRDAVDTILHTGDASDVVNVFTTLQKG